MVLDPAVRERLGGDPHDSHFITGLKQANYIQKRGEKQIQALLILELFKERRDSNGGPASVLGENSIDYLNQDY